MGRKIESTRARKGSSKDADTAAYGQPQGSDERATEDGRLDRMPHERDESAEATGNRLDQTPVPSGARIDKAVDDLGAGRRDTERRGVPSDVPSPKSSAASRRDGGGSGV